MKKFLRINLIAIATSLVGAVASFHNPIQALFAEEIGDAGDAVRMPSMSFYSDPRSEMSFCWTTTNITDTDLEVIEKTRFDNSTGFDDSTISRYIKHYNGSIEKSKISGDGFIHRVVATNLSPDTNYVYRFGDETLNNWSEIGSFKTASDSNRNFSFLHISDPQGDNELHYESYHQLISDAVKMNPEWIALTGDITDDSHFGRSIDLSEWELALTEQWDNLKDIPVMAVSGNHDGAINAFHSRYNYAYVEGSDTSTGDYYSFDYQGVHFTCINSNDTPNPKDPHTRGLSKAQMDWLEADLAAHQNDKFLIVMMHKGMFDSGGHSANDDQSDYDIEVMRKEVAPLFTKYGVDLVLEGHDHLYSLSYPMMVDEYVGQSEYYRIDNNYKESRRDFGEYKDVYTFSNVSGTFYFNTGTASGQKYYAPIIGGPMEPTIFDTVNPNQKMFTMVDVLDDSILLRTYLSTSNETSLFKIYAIAKDNEGEDARDDKDIYPDLKINEGYTFTYKFQRYEYEADVVLYSQTLTPSESNLVGKFTGDFIANNEHGSTVVRLYKTGKLIIENKIVFEEFGKDPLEYNSSGQFRVNDDGTFTLQILDEKDNYVDYVAYEIGKAPKGESSLWTFILGIAGGSVAFAVVLFVLFILLIAGGVLLTLGLIAGLIVLIVMLTKKRKARK